jgi:hypothetical protein
LCDDCRRISRCSGAIVAADWSRKVPHWQRWRKHVLPTDVEPRITTLCARSTIWCLGHMSPSGWDNSKSEVNGRRVDKDTWAFRKIGVIWGAIADGRAIKSVMAIPFYVWIITQTAMVRNDIPTIEFYVGRFRIEKNRNLGSLLNHICFHLDKYNLDFRVGL